MGQSLNFLYFSISICCISNGAASFILKCTVSTIYSTLYLELKFFNKLKDIG